MSQREREAIVDSWLRRVVTTGAIVWISVFIIRLMFG